MTILYRCNICDNVSDKSLQTATNKVTKGHFHPDPNKRGGFICDDCFTEYFVVSLEFMLESEEDLSWKNFSLKPKKRKK